MQDLRYFTVDPSLNIFSGIDLCKWRDLYNFVKHIHVIICRPSPVKTEITESSWVQNLPVRGNKSDPQCQVFLIHSLISICNEFGSTVVFPICSQA